MSAPHTTLPWLDYAAQHWGHGWAICANTERNRARYARCLSRQAYNKLYAQWEREITSRFHYERLEGNPNFQVYDRTRGQQEPIASVRDVHYAERIVDALNRQEHERYG